MKAKQLYQCEGIPADRTNYDSGLIILQKLAPVYHDVLINGTVIWTHGVRAAATDGAFTYINQTYFDALPSHGQRAFLLGHEVGHDVLRHSMRGKFYRERGYLTIINGEKIPWDKDIAGRAMDEVINHDLVAHGMEFIEEGCLSPEFNRNMTFEEVYLTLYRKQQDEQDQADDDSQGSPESGDDDSATDDMSDTGDSDQSDDGDDDADSSDGDDGESGDQSGEDGDDLSDSAGAGDEGEESDEDGGSGSSGTDGEGSDDGEGEGSGSGQGGESGTPEASSHGAFDDHLEPVYVGTPEEQREAAEDDKGEMQRKADNAMDNLADQEGSSSRGKHSRGWQESGYRHSLEEDASNVDWHTELADVVTRAGDGGINNWSKINRRRYAVTGCITPTRKGTMNRMAITIDISISVSREAYANFVKEFAALLDLMQPTSGCLVMFTNTRVTETYEVMTGADLMDLNYPKGGGTTMSAAVDFMEENGLDADVHLCFTDGEFFGDMDEWNKLTDAGVVIVLDRHPDSRTMRDMTACGIKYIVASDVEMAA